jgi:hypothetical protein
MRPYNFQVELDALREQFAQEHSLTHKYLKSTYDNIRPIQILIEGFLSDKIKDRDRRKEVRLAILSLWLEQNVESTYDLTIYQCSTIVTFLELSEDGSYGDRTKRFLSDSQAKAEGRDITGESEFHTFANESDVVPIRLTDFT